MQILKRGPSFRWIHSRARMHGLAIGSSVGSQSQTRPCSQVPLLDTQPARLCVAGLSLHRQSSRSWRAETGLALERVLRGDHWSAVSLPAGLSAHQEKGGSGTALHTLSRSDSLPSPSPPTSSPLRVFETLSCPFPAAQLPDRKSD